MHDIGTLGTRSQGEGINGAGQVVGYYVTALGPYHAFLYDATHGIVDLNSLIDPASGWVLGDAMGINDTGQITGMGTINGQSVAFVLTPTPEPSSIVLAALGLLGLAIRRWRCAARLTRRRT
jgi:probable HAF family extracellular repeat protein